jgi:hypothetical protein
MDGTAILESVSIYLHREAQLARSEDEHEDFSISLKVLALLSDGWATGRGGLFDLACGYAIGLPSSKIPYKREKRAAFLHRQQLLRLIPDYDYSNEKPPKDDPTDGRKRFYGNRYTGRLRDMGTSPVSPDDPTTTSEPTANYAAASWAMGDRPNAEGGYPAPSFACAADHSCIPNAYRGSAPKSIRSHAQILAWRRYKDHATRGAVASYFGA